MTQTVTGKKIRIMNILLLIVILYTAIAIILYVTQRSFMYFPPPDQPHLADYDAEDMRIVSFVTEDSLSLTSWYKKPEENKPVIILFHGNASHMGMSALKTRIMMDEGYGAFLPAYRGYAGNPGKPHEQGFYKDARAAILWLLSQGYTQQDIILYGESLGTGIAIEMAVSEFPDVKAVILESPYTSFTALARQSYFWLPLNILMRDRFDSIDKIAHITAPVFIINGARDMLVPPYMGQALYDAAQTQNKYIHTIANAGHNDMHQQGAQDHILRYITTLL